MQPLSPALQVFYNDAILLNSAIARRDPQVPQPAQVPAGHIFSDSYTKAVELMRIGDQLAEFVQKNAEMGHLIDGISVVNQDMLKRNADLERKNEELSRRLAKTVWTGGSPAIDDLNAPLSEEEMELVTVLFDRSFYLDKNKDVRESGADPLSHFMEHGWREGRSPHPLFDAAFYLTHHPGLLESGPNSLVHYLRAGATSGSNPHPLFDTAFYLHEYPDVVEHGLNPLVHFVKFGAQEGRNPHPFFNTADYLAANPDLAASRSNALIHYVCSGAAEGRPLRVSISQEDRTPYAVRISRIEPDAQELHLQKAASRQFLLQPVISVVVPVYRVALPVLKAMVESVRMQSYSRWELCLAHGDPDDRPARAWLRTTAQDDRRIKVDCLNGEPRNLR